MTAEIAILNREAVALAADSAVTVRSSRGHKIWNTANKLFPLSKFEPVGVMVYGNASFCGVPWETIIKWYRQDRHDTKFKTLPEYAADICKFVEQNTTIFSNEMRDGEIGKELLWQLLDIRDEVERKAKRLLATNALSDEDVAKLVEEALREHVEFLEKQEEVIDPTSGSVLTAASSVSSAIPKILDAALQKLPRPASVDPLIAKLLTLVLTRNWEGSSSSGVVIAGFGRDDVFPRLRAFSPHLIVADRLKHVENASIDISPSKSAVVRPFAQTDMVHMFMEGVDTNYDVFVREYFQEVLLKIPSVLTGNDASVLSIGNKSLDDIRAALALLADEFVQATRDFKRNKFISPIVDTVSSLPKEELAAMAESLVNLVSFRRRMSPDAETVGGPIDVAVISKGDGLIWIRRKHYFDADLNQHFTANYHRDRRP